MMKNEVDIVGRTLDDFRRQGVDDVLVVDTVSAGGRYDDRMLLKFEDYR